jgi:hypothetical protein
MWHIEVTTWPEGSQGFPPFEHRGVVERTNAWHGRARRQSQDDERTPESRAAMLDMSHLPRRRRRRTVQRRPAFHDRSIPADALKLTSGISG